MRDEAAVPLTQDWADAIHSLAGAAELLDGQSDPQAKLLKVECYREIQLILTRGLGVPGASPGNAPKAPSKESVLSLPSLPVDSLPGSEKK